MEFNIGGLKFEINSTVISATDAKKLFDELPAYDKDKKVGVISVGDTGARFAFLKDELSDTMVPFYFDGENPAKVVVGIEKLSGNAQNTGYGIKNTYSPKQFDTVLNTDDFSTDVAEEFKNGIWPDILKILYGYYSPDATPFIEKVIDVEQAPNKSGAIIVTNEKDGKMVYFKSADNVSNVGDAIKSYWIKENLTDKEVFDYTKANNDDMYLVRSIYQTGKGVVIVGQSTKTGEVKTFDKLACSLDLRIKLNDGMAYIGIKKNKKTQMRPGFAFNVGTIEDYQKLVAGVAAPVNLADYVTRVQYNADMQNAQQNYQQQLQQQKNQYQQNLANKDAQIANLKANSGKRVLAILGGVDATHTKGIGKKKQLIDDCFVVAPHVNGGDSVYLVEGKSVKEVSDLKLTPDEFVTIIKGEPALAKETPKGTEKPKIEKSGDKITKVNNKDVSGMTISGVRTYYTKPGESVVRVKKFSDNIAKFTWGQDTRYRLDFTDDLRSALNNIQSGIGDDYWKNPRQLKLNVAAKHGLVTGIALGIATIATVWALSGAGANAALQNANEQLNDAQQATDDANKGKDETTLNSNSNIIAEARNAALLKLGDETKSAVEYGKTQAGLNAELVGTLVGNQWADGTFDTRGIQDLYKTNIDDFEAYLQQNGLTYTAQVYQDADNDKAADKDENGNYLMVMQDFTLTQKEVEDAGKTYSYDEATKEGLWSETAKLVVNAAIEAGMPVATLNTDGSYRMNYIYQGDSREAMVGEIGENATEEFEKSWENALEIALESGLAGSDAITNPKDVLKNEDVVYSASLIAGAGAEVLSVSDGMIYIKSADNNNLYTVPSTNGDSYEVSDLLNSMDTAIKNKTVEEYAQASDIFQAVLESGRVLSESALETLNAKYGDMYISHNLSNVNGNRTYYSTILTVDAEGNVEQSYGKEVYKSGAMNTSIAAVLSVDDTIALTGAQKQGYSTGAIHQEEVATEAEIAKSDEKSRA